MKKVTKHNLIEHTMGGIRGFIVYCIIILFSTILVVGINKIPLAIIPMLKHSYIPAVIGGIFKF